jgi:CRISPR-associated protein (TIGR03984 family)
MKLSKIQYDISPVVVPHDFDGDIKAWFSKQARTNNMQWLLAHAYDGIIWGIMRNGELHLSNCLVGPELNANTLQNARLFDLSGEFLLWRTEAGFKARLLKEGLGEEKVFFDENQLLWGDNFSERQIKDGFIKVHQGSEGLYHAPPFLDEKVERMALKLRHFVDYDEDGQAIKFSRLLSLCEFDEKEVI